MTDLLEFQPLRRQRQIADADAELQARGLLDPRPRESVRDRLYRARHRIPDPKLVLKTWDVLRATSALVARLDPADPVLDMGCYACDILPVLKRMGFTALAGVDLNPAVTGMPYGEEIDYRVGDLLSTPWPDGSFAAVTSISVIEHGVADEPLCAEVARLLRPGGVFIFTTDYWDPKIETTERIFDLDWRIFDAAEVRALIDTAARHGLRPVADPALEVSTPAVHFSGKDYTFLYGALVRD